MERAGMRCPHLRSVGFELSEVWRAKLGDQRGARCPVSPFLLCVSISFGV